MVAGCEPRLMLKKFGPALAEVDVPARATIANMGAECGVTTSVFPSDGVTRGFLEAQGRGDLIGIHSDRWTRGPCHAARADGPKPRRQDKA